MFPYKGEAFKIYDKVTRTAQEEDCSYIVNKVYKLNDSRWWFVNSRGYLHTLIPTRITISGKFAYYSVFDYLLNKDALLERVGDRGRFGTREETIKCIETWFK